MKTALLLGSSGGIGSEVKNKLLEINFNVVCINREDIDFSDRESGTELKKVLTKNNPDVIVNCTGHFCFNDEESGPSLSVNVGSNWSIIHHFVKAPPTKPVRFIMIGSSSYIAGKKNYMLYSASKAALYNLWQGATDYFEDKLLNIDIVNPARTRTKMSLVFDQNLDFLDPKKVADEIVKLIVVNSNSRCVNISL
jgi:short-subunit dehydrogenase